MKKLINPILLFLTFVFLLILTPNVGASETGLRNINDDTNIYIGNLVFTSIKFNDNTNTSTNSFGITGSVYNICKMDIDVVSNTYYYDKNEILIGTSKSSQVILAGEINAYNNMASLSVLKEGYSVSDIYYYKINLDLISTPATSNTPSQKDSYKHYDYVIDKYDIDVIVNENNTLDITETITAYFNKEKHGIYRAIPLRNTVVRLDGSKSNNVARVTNLKVDNEYTASKEYDNYKIQIGSPNKTITGKQKYVISYTYNLGKDPKDDYDELYYNLIGTDWNTVIGNITFSIVMPKDFDVSKLGFSSGTYGSTDNSNVTYSVSDNVIKGSYNGILKPKEALTIRCELDEGYFVGAKIPVDFTVYIMFIFPTIFLIIAIFLWYRYGNDAPIVETVEFYPPEGLNSLEIGFLYKGIAKDNDVISLLIYLANKGYIQICDKNTNFSSKKLNLDEEVIKKSNLKVIELEKEIDKEKSINPNSSKIKILENLLEIYKNIDKPIDYELSDIEKTKLMGNTKGFIIRKLKNYDGNDVYERMFMGGLFNYSSSNNEVTEKDLHNSFYFTLDSIKSNINDSDDKIFENKSMSKILYAFIGLIFLIITCLPFIGSIDYLISNLIFGMFPAFGISLILNGIINIDKGKVGNIFCGLLVSFPVVVLIDQFLKEPIYLLTYIYGVVIVAIITYLIRIMPRRTSYGCEILGKIRGFRNFLETVEKDKLEKMVLEDPTYFYDILPYTYVLGISNKWIKKFESIGLKAPDWYVGSPDFSTSKFNSFMKNTMSLAKKSMTSSPSSSGGSSSSSSSSSSGGGSSGGGSGGGGGGSW